MLSTAFFMLRGAVRTSAVETLRATAGASMAIGGYYLYENANRALKNHGFFSKPTYQPTSVPTETHCPTNVTLDPSYQPHNDSQANMKYLW